MSTTDRPTGQSAGQHDGASRPTYLKLAAALVAGIAVTAVTSLSTPWEVTVLLGWDAAAVVYAGWTWALVWRMNADATAAEAVRNDPSRVITDVVLLSASVASLLGVALVIVRAANSSGLAKGLLLALVIISIIVSWLTVHTTFMLRYARLYYTGPDGGVDFNDDEPPRYADFAYLAFTVGMTFQVSDTPLTATGFRATALRHALLSFLFGTVILASTINLVAGLSK